MEDVIILINKLVVQNVCIETGKAMAYEKLYNKCFELEKFIGIKFYNN